MVELDASDSTKFSRHLIITFPGNVVFRNNKHVEQFVNSLCKKITEKALLNYSGDTSKLPADALALRRLFFLKKCRDENIRYKLFFDMSVYDSDKNFRMPLSAKHIDIRRRHFNY